jgi:NADH-quinone oxidoreductase subunit I
MEEPPHEMQLGATDKDYYLGLTGAAVPTEGGGDK